MMRHTPTTTHTNTLLPYTTLLRSVMQIFEELIHKVNKQEIQRFGSWLYVLSRNHCLMQLRAEKNRHHVSIDEFVEFPLAVHPEDEDRKSIRMNFRHSCASRMPSFD